MSDLRAPLARVYWSRRDDGGRVFKGSAFPQETARQIVETLNSRFAHLEHWWGLEEGTS